MARRLTSTERTTYRRMFPNLVLDRVWVLGEATSRYNCLAWALGRTDAWIWPWGTRNATAAEMTAFLRGRGYQPAFGGPLAVYGPGSIAHAARFSNRWSSKCGQLLLITHGIVEINGGVYGSLRQQYARRTVAASFDVESEVTSAEPDVEPFSDEELVAVTSRVESIAASLRDRFDAAFTAWINSWTWQQPSPPTNNEAFADLISLGAEIAPLLVGRLTDVDMWPALYPLEFLLPNELTISFELDDPETMRGEQHRARSVALAWARAHL